MNSINLKSDRPKNDVNPENFNPDDYMRPDWLYEVQQEYPEYFREITEINCLAIDDYTNVDCTNNPAREQINEDAVEKMTINFNNYGFKKNRFPIVTIEVNGFLTSYFTQHRCYSLKGSREQGYMTHAPNVTVKLNPFLEDYEREFILGEMSGRENEEQEDTVDYTIDDRIRKLYNQFKSYRVADPAGGGTKPATNQEKLDAVEEYLKSQRSKSHSPYYKSTKKWQRDHEKVAVLFGVKSPLKSRHTLKSAHDWARDTYNGEFDYNGFELDDLVLPFGNGKVTLMHKHFSQFNDKWYMLYWPRNRDDRNFTDLLKVLENIDKNLKGQIGVVLGLGTTSTQQKCHTDRVEYYNLIKSRVDRLDEDNINILGFIPEHDNDDKEALIPIADVIND